MDRVKVSTYKDLIFWQRSYEVARMCIQLARKLPKETTSRVIADQIIRSSMSIGANISEGFGRFGSKEYSRFLQVALGSANETDYWLLLISDSFPEVKNTVTFISQKNQETIKMLTASINSIRKQK